MQIPTRPTTARVNVMLPVSPPACGALVLTRRQPQKVTSHKLQATTVSTLEVHRAWKLAVLAVQRIILLLKAAVCTPSAVDARYLALANVSGSKAA